MRQKNKIFIEVEEKHVDRHIWWGLVVISVMCIISFTLIYLQEHSWIIRFEMDNNTLEAVKSINWSAIPK